MPPIKDFSQEHLEQAASEVVAQAVGVRRLPSVSVALSFENHLTVIAHGQADLERRIPATPETAYALGSISKQFTAAAVLRLADKGALLLDHQISTYLPEATRLRWQPTLKQLLSHTSGLGPDGDLPMIRGEILTHRGILELLEDSFSEPPGEAWQYSNLGYYLLGMIVERASGHSLSEFLHREVVARAGLESTWCAIELVPENRLAVGYRDVGGRHRALSSPLGDATFGTGGVYATAADIVHWERALAGGEVILKSSYDAMTQPADLSSGTDLPPNAGAGIMTLPPG